MNEVIGFAIVAIIFLVLGFKGVARTFKRQPVVALLMLIFLFPFYFVWVLLEALGFMGE